YVAALGGGRAETFDTRYIFAHVDRSEVAARIRLNYTFTPNLSLETYVEPFASSGRFHSFGELRAPRSGELLTYGEDGTTIVVNEDGSRTVTADGGSFTIAPRDFNVRSLRTNAVLRWEWRPGSTAYLVWQQNSFAERAPGDVRPGDIFDSFISSADHYLALKVSYCLPVRRRRSVGAPAGGEQRALDATQPHRAGASAIDVELERRTHLDVEQPAAAVDAGTEAAVAGRHKIELELVAGMDREREPAAQHVADLR